MKGDRDDRDLKAWRGLWDRASRPVALTGAGISVASGLPTGSAKWNGIALRELFTRRRFEEAPGVFFACYRDWLWKWREAVPNPAHAALAEAAVPVVTLNVDGLHRRAGSVLCLELHGRLSELICPACGLLVQGDRAFKETVPHCPDCRRILQPNMVFVGEPVRHFAEAVDLVGDADLLLVVGTRLDVAPVNQFPAVAGRKGIPTIRINRRAERLLPALIAR